MRGELPSETTIPMRPAQWLGLDALRAWAAVGVVWLHACVPYSSPAMPGLTWCVIDSPDPTVTKLMWSIEVVIMPIFLTMAGFLAASSLLRRRPAEFFRGRLRRLGVPLLLCTLLLVPTELYIWLLGWLAEGHITPRKFASLKFPDHLDQHLWGLSHLWFLQYVLSYMAILAGGAALSRRRQLNVRSITVPALITCGLTALVTLCMAPEVVWGFQHAFLPVASKWIYSGAFFFAGVAWFAVDPSLEKLQQHGRRLLLPGICLLAAAVRLGIWRLENLNSLENIGLIDTCVGGLSFAAAGLVTFGLIGWLQAKVARLGRSTQTLAMASFTIYLLHHPIVALTHISLKFGASEIHPMVKNGVAMMLGLAVPVTVHWLSQQRRRSQAANRDEILRTPLQASSERMAA